MRSLLLVCGFLLLSFGLHAQPVANFTASPTSGCAPMVVSFTNTSTGSPTSYSWNFGSASIPGSSLANPTVAYTTPGTYTVSLTVSNASGSNTKTQTGFIVVKQVPTVSFSGSPTTACVGTSVAFLPSVTWNATGTGSYLWNFGDGSTSTSASPSHTYTASGAYTVKLTAVNSAGCPATDTQANYITVYPKPVPAFSASDTAICQLNGTTTFTASPSGTSPFTYVWDFGDGSGPSTASSPVTHAYSSVGSYTVNMIVTDAHGCKDSMKKVNYIRVRTLSTGFTAPTTGCESAPLTVSNTTGTSGALITWSFGDGKNGSGATVNHTYTTAGTYTITQYVTIGGCTASTSRSITINPKPSVSFTFSPLHPCPAPVPVQFYNNAASGVTYNWFFGDGVSGVGNAPTHVYAKSDTFTITLTGYNSFGCTASATQDVTIFPAVYQMFSDLKSGCAPLNVTFSDTLTTYDDNNVVSPYPFAITGRNWSFGDGSSSFAAKPYHTFNLPGLYRSIVTTTTSNGCTFKDTINIAAGNKPVANFGGSPRTVCVKDPVSFLDSSTSSGLPINSWNWDFGDNTASIVQNPIQKYGSPGTYDVTLVVGVNGCFDTITRQQYIHVNYPKSIMNYRVSCDTPLLVHFQDSSLGASSHIFHFGDGSTSTASTVSHQYASAGIYYPSLVTYNSATGCKDSLTVRLNLNPFTANFAAIDTTLCLYDSLRLNMSSSGGGNATAYSWWLGMGSAVPSFNFNLIPSDGAYKSFYMTKGGQYHLALKVKDQNGCAATILKSNYVTVGDPDPKIGAMPSRGCAPAYITYIDSSAYAAGTFGAIRTWDFGDGSPKATTTGATIGHSYGVGSFGVQLIVQDNIGCVDSVFVPNYMVVTHPTAIFTPGGVNACVGVPFTFFSSSLGTGLSYFWTFGDGGTSTQPSPKHAYSSAGTYTVRLIVTDFNGCSDTSTKVNVVTVSPRPTAGFTMSDTLAVCPPLIVKFTDASIGGKSYLWDFGTGGASSTLQNPSNTYSSPNFYTIRQVVTNSVGCRDTAYGHAKVLGYAGVLNYAPLKGCAPLSVNFQATGVDGVPGFVYDFGDGTPAVGTTNRSISHVYKKAGAFVPTIILTDNKGCTAKSIGLDTIKVDGVLAGFSFSPFPACDKGTVTFTDTSKGAFSTMNPVTWKFHDGSISHDPHPSMTYSGPGTYPVTLFASTNTGCQDTFKGSITFYPFPKIDAGPDTTICLSDSATLRPTGGVVYSWSPAGSLSCVNCTNPYAFPIINTRYTVVGTDEHGCSNKDTVTVRIRTKTIATASPGTEICSGDTVVLEASGGTRYQWIPSTGLDSPNTAHPHASPDSTQHYLVVVQLASCIPDTVAVELIVHPTPTVSAGADQSIIAGNKVQLQALGSSFITQWLWSPTEGLSCTGCAAPEASPKQSTTYVILASTEYDCRAQDSVHVTVVCDNSQVFLPNAFTPEGNGVNDVFYPRGRGLKVINYFRIYNRWGELVFERSNMQVDDRTQGWDGKKNGKLLSPDIYVYTVDAVCDTGAPIKWQGDVLLLR
ncbi:MAG: PKD domain-containing protein [Bacteroidetes bacterium]|nr:PKD domain-containing protein [Bacteroidota bacterium]